MKATLIFFHLKYQHMMWSIQRRAFATPILRETTLGAPTPLRKLSRRSSEEDRSHHHCFYVIDKSEISSSPMSQETKIFIFSSGLSLYASAIKESLVEFQKKMQHIIARRKYQRLRLANFVQNLELMCRHWLTFALSTLR